MSGLVESLKKVGILPVINIKSSKIEETMLAKNLGCNVVKFFPAELSGGIAALKLYESAFQGMLFLPTGGITLENIEGYFRAKNVLACGGSFMANEKLLSEGDNETVTKKCLELIDQYKKTRGE